VTLGVPRRLVDVRERASLSWIFSRSASLTNVRNGEDYEIFPFNEPVVHRILEELFDGKDVASAVVDHVVWTRCDLVATALASIELPHAQVPST
jgi:hypothetical protein